MWTSSGVYGTTGQFLEEQRAVWGGLNVMWGPMQVACGGQPQILLGLVGTQAASSPPVLQWSLAVHALLWVRFPASAMTVVFLWWPSSSEVIA